MLRAFALATVLACAVLLSAGPTLAQTESPVAEPEATTDDSTVVYEADFFTRYNPVNAADMLSRIPGLSLTLDESRQFGQQQQSQRGLGAGENQILIDGKRIAGKESEGIDALTRIPAGNVERIEIIRGTSGELDVRSAGEIINVVLKEGVSTAAGSWQASVTMFDDGHVNPGAELSYGSSIGDLDYLFSVELEPTDIVFKSFEISKAPDGSLVDIRDEVEDFDQNEISLNGNFTYTFSDNVDARLNLLYETMDVDAPRLRDIFTEGPSGEPVLTQIIHDFSEITWNRWEIGGDIEARFGDTGRFKLLGIINQQINDSIREIRDITDSADLLTSVEIRDRTDQERIVRTSLTFGVGEGQELEIGAEGAQTMLDSAIENFAIVDDEHVQIDIPNADSVVEELRLEPFIVHNWQISDEFSLETGLTFEISEIDQQGTDVENTRSFFFARPSLDGRWDISPTTQLRASIRRDISQLSFQDFTATLDFQDDDSPVNAGNPELAQEKAWQYEAELEYRLPSDGGVLTLRAFYHDIENVIDFVDVTPDPTPEDPFPTPVSARGNIGDGTSYGVELQGSLRLGFVGLEEAFVSGEVELTETSVTDPFLGTDRRFQFRPATTWSASFRHDVTDWNASYGFDITNRGPRQSVDIDKIIHFSSRPTINVFIERRVFGNMTLRLDGRNITNTSNNFVRTRFPAGIAGGVITEIEDRDFRRGAEWELSLRGNF